jgi:hypothetical protein
MTALRAWVGAMNPLNEGKVRHIIMLPTIEKMSLQIYGDLPFKHIAMGLTSLFSNGTDQRFKRMLNAMDVFTKGCAVPMTDKDRARIGAAFEQTLRKITRHGEERFGGMRRDNGGEMTSSYIKWCVRDKGINHFFSSA